MKSAAVAQKAAAPARVAKPVESATAQPAVGAPAYVQAMLQPAVQAKCAACDAGDKPVQMWSCGEYTKPTCTDEVQQKLDDEADHDAPVQTKCAKCDDCDKCTTHDPHDHAAPVQQAAKASRSASPQMVHSAARVGLAGANQSLPHGARIQQAFGGHDISGVRTSIGGAAAHATESMGALAYTSGDRIAFRGDPDLRLAAHEAAHVVQQRAGLKLEGGVGRAGDRWETHADSVADAVVGGRSAEPLLDGVAGAAPPPPAPAGAGHQVQHHLTIESHHLHEREPAPVHVAHHAGPPGGAAKAAGGKAGAAKGQDGTSALEAADRGQEHEAPPEGVSQPGQQPGGGGAATAVPTTAPAADAEPPAPATGAGGGVNASCYNAASPPRDTDEQPTSDQRSTQPQDETDVTQPPWPAEADQCPAETAAAGAAPQSGPVAASAPMAHGPAGGGGGAPGGGGGAGPGAGGPASAHGPAGGPQQPAGPGGPGAGGKSASREVAHMGAAADKAEAGSEDQTASMQGTIGAAEAQRASAWNDFSASQDTLAGASARIPRLAQNASFADGDGPASRLMTGFMGRVGGQISGAIAFAQGEAPGGLGRTGNSTLLDISATIAIEKQTISQRIGAARIAAYAGAATARGHIESQYASSLATVEAETQAAIEALDTEHETSIDSIEDLQSEGLDGVNSTFAQGRRDHEAKGPDYTRQAVAKGQAYVDGYEPCKAGPGNDYVKMREDGFWDGCLTVRRAKAQQDAACKTAAGYKKGFLRTANKKGYDLLPLRRQYRCAVISGGREVTKALDTSHNQLIAGLRKSLAAAKSGLITAYTQNMAAVDGALEANLKQLAAQEYKQRQAADDTGYLKQLAVEQLVHLTAAGLAKGIGAAMDSLDKALGGLKERFSKGGTPDAATLAPQLTAIEAQLGGGMATLLDKMREGETSGEAKIVELGNQSVAALAQISTSNDQATADSETGFAQQIGGLIAGATTAFGTLTSNHVTQTQKTSTDGVATMQDAVGKFAAGIETIYTKCDEAIAKSLGELDTQFQGDLGKLDAKIQWEAHKAAKKEQPAWKGVLAIVLIILVVIAAAVISIVTLGAGASLFAVILVGAIVGAISAGLIQIINNWSQGEDLTHGLAQAMIMGAIGGAVGGAIGFGAGGLAASVGAAGGRIATQFAIQLGGDLLSEAVTQTIGHFAFGQEFNWQGFLMAGAMSSVSFRPTRPHIPSAHPAAPHPSAHASAPHPEGPHVGSPHPTEGPHVGGGPHETPAAPHGEPAAPHAEPAAPHGEAAAPHGEPAAPHGEAAAAHGEPGAPHGEPAAPHGEPGGAHGGAAPAAPKPNRAAAVRQIAAGAGVGFGVELLTSWISGERFDAGKAFSSAAGAAVAARASRMHGAHASAPHEPAVREPVVREAGAPAPRPSALDRFRSFDPLKLTERAQARIDRLGARIAGRPVEPQAPGRVAPVREEPTAAPPRAPHEEPTAAPPRAPHEEPTAGPRAPHEEPSAAPPRAAHEEPNGGVRRPEAEVAEAARRSQEPIPREMDPHQSAGRLTDGELANTTTSTMRVGTEEHHAGFRRRGDGIVCEVCSAACLRATRALDMALERLPEGPLRERVQAMRDRVTQLEGELRQNIPPISHQELIELSGQVANTMREAGGAVRDLGEQLNNPRLAETGRGNEPMFERTYHTDETGAERIRTDNLQAPDGTRVTTSERQTVGVDQLDRLHLGAEDNVIYVVRDSQTGAVIKVGETAGSAALHTFEKYRDAAVGIGMHERIQIEVNVVGLHDPTGSRTPRSMRKAVETELRYRLEGEGHIQPWENQDPSGRMGRRNSMIPFEHPSGGHDAPRGVGHGARGTREAGWYPQDGTGGTAGVRRDARAQPPAVAQAVRDLIATNQPFSRVQLAERLGISESGVRARLGNDAWVANLRAHGVDFSTWPPKLIR